MSLAGNETTTNELEEVLNPPENPKDAFLSGFDEWLGNWRSNNRMKKATSIINRGNVVSRSKLWSALSLANNILKRIGDNEFSISDDEATKLYELEELSGLEWGIGNENGATTSINPQAIEELKTILNAVIKKSQTGERNANLVIARNEGSQKERDTVEATEREGLINLYGERFVNLEKVMMELLDPVNGLPVVGNTDLSCYEPDKVVLSGKKIHIYRGDTRDYPQEFLCSALKYKDLPSEEIAYVRDYILGLRKVIDIVKVKRNHTNNYKDGRPDPVFSGTLIADEAKVFAGGKRIQIFDLPVEWVTNISALSYKLAKNFQHSGKNDLQNIMSANEGTLVPGVTEEVYVWGGFSISELRQLN